MNVLAALASVVIAVTTLTQPITLKAGTKIACVLQTGVDSRTTQSGDTFTLHVDDPSQPALAGARIKGHVTRVNGPFGMQPAEIAFLFDSITFANGAKEPIRAFVVSRNVVQRTATGPGAPVPNRHQSARAPFWRHRLRDLHQGLHQAWTADRL